METLVDNEEYELTIADCKEYLGPKGLENFEKRMESRQERVGQAWFNSVRVDDQDKLRGSIYDPFYKTSWGDVIKALRFLLEN